MPKQGSSSFDLRFVQSWKRHMMPNHRVEEMLEAVAAAERRRPANPTADDRERGQDHQRHGHRPGRLVDVVLDIMRHPRRSEKSHVHQAEHVKRRHASREKANATKLRAVLKSLATDFILAEEAGEWRNASDGECRD